MTNATTTCSHSRLILIALGGLLVLPPFTAPLAAPDADPAFLREVDQEARRQAQTLLFNPPSATISSPTATPAAPAATAASDRLKVGLDQAGFEQTLRNRLPGSYTLYQQLDSARKQQVYQSYQQDPRLNTISEQITRPPSAAR